MDQPVLAADGKFHGRSHDCKKGMCALHSVRIVASDYGLSMGQLAMHQPSTINHQLSTINYQLFTHRARHQIDVKLD